MKVYVVSWIDAGYESEVSSVWTTAVQAAEEAQRLSTGPNGKYVSFSWEEWELDKPGKLF